MGGDALARAMRSASPQAAPLIQRSQYLADALRALQESGDKIGSNTELYGKLAATAINQFSKNRTDKRLKEVDGIERSNKAGRALAELTGEAFTPAAIPEEQGLMARLLRREPAPAPAQPAPMPPAPMAPQPQPQPPPAPQMMGAPNIDQAAPIPDVSFGPTPAGPNYPLGIRNNNPGNLRDTPTPWQGATGAAGGFEQFDTPESGLRAMAKNLNTYGKRGINTLEGIISTWAPPSENPTGNYVAAISKALGVDPRQPLDLNNPQVLEALSSAMIQFENGRNPYTPEQLGAGVQMALGGARQPPPVQQPAPAEMLAGPTAPAGSLQPAGATPQPRRPAPEQMAFLKKLLTSSDYDEQDMGLKYAQKLQEEMATPIEYDTKVQDGNLISVDPRNPSGFSVTPIAQLQAKTGRASELGYQIPGDPFISVDAQGKPSVIQSAPTGYSNTPAGELRGMTGGPADPTSPQNRLQALQGFRAELKPILEDATKLTRSINALRAGYAQRNGAGDIAMINGLQRLIDEGVVREGDVALQLKGQGLQGSVAGLKGYMGSGGFFDDPQVRDKIAAAAEAMYAKTNGTFRSRAMSYKGIVGRAVGDEAAFEDVLPAETRAALGWDEKPAGQPGATKPKPYNEAQFATFQKAHKRGAPIGAADHPYIVSTPQQKNGLPAGAYYIDPDGNIRRKR